MSTPTAEPRLLKLLYRSVHRLSTISNLCTGGVTRYRGCLSCLTIGVNMVWVWLNRKIVRCLFSVHHMYMYVFIYTRLSICVCINIYIYIYMCVCMYIYIYIYSDLFAVGPNRSMQERSSIACPIVRSFHGRCLCAQCNEVGTFGQGYHCLASYCQLVLPQICQARAFSDNSDHVQPSLHHS